MCGQCRAATVDVDWYSSGAVDTLAGRRTARVRLAVAADAALEPLGLRARTHPGILAITVGTTSGRSAMVAILGQLQAAAASLAGRALDPLDDPTIASRAARAGDSGGAGDRA
jgi:hypothetical protein